MAKKAVDIEGKSPAEILDLLKGSGDSGGKKKKFIQFPNVTQFNAVLDVMKESPETKSLLEEFQAGEAKNKSNNDGIGDILNAVNTLISKTKDAEKLAVLTKQKEKMEKQIKKSNPTINLSFVMKFLLATNKYKEIQEIAKQISA